MQINASEYQKGKVFHCILCQTSVVITEGNTKMTAFSPYQKLLDTKANDKRLLKSQTLFSNTDRLADTATDTATEDGRATKFHLLHTNNVRLISAKRSRTSSASKQNLALTTRKKKRNKD